MTQHPHSWTQEQRQQLEVATRLRRGDVDTLLELYDQLAPTLFGYALAITSNRRQAIRALRQAFLDVWDAPVLLSDPRVPPLIAIAALVTDTVNRQSVRRRSLFTARPAIVARRAVQLAP